MQGISSLLASQVLVLLFVGSYAWPRQVPDDSDLIKRMYSYTSQLKRPYDFGLGKRSLEEPASYEDFSSPALSDAYNFQDKRAVPQYSFGLGKRNRAYGFGLGKRLEYPWKSSGVSANRQERRSKIYSFGLGKRASHLMSNGPDDYYDMQGSDKRAAGGRQFSFGLGKRDVGEVSSSNSNNNNSNNVNMTS